MSPTRTQYRFGIQRRRRGRVDPDRNGRGRQVPNAVVVDPTGRYVYVANWNDGTISEYAANSDGSSATSARRLPAPSRHRITSTHGAIVYAANLGSKPSRNTPSARPGCTHGSGNVAAGGSPISITVNPTGHYVYVVDETGNAVSEYAIGAGIAHLARHRADGQQSAIGGRRSSGRYAYVANYNDATVSAYTIGSGGTLTAIGTVPSGSCPESVAVDPDGTLQCMRRTGAATACRRTPSGRAVAEHPRYGRDGKRPWFIASTPPGSDVYVRQLQRQHRLGVHHRRGRRARASSAPYPPAAVQRHHCGLLIAPEQPLAPLVEPDYCPASAATMGCHVRQKCSCRKVKKGCGRCGPGTRSCSVSKKLYGNQTGTCRGRFGS